MCWLYQVGNRPPRRVVLMGYSSSLAGAIAAPSMDFFTSTFTKLVLEGVCKSTDLTKASNDSLFSYLSLYEEELDKGSSLSITVLSLDIDDVRWGSWDQSNVWDRLCIEAAEVGLPSVLCRSGDDVEDLERDDFSIDRKLMREYMIREGLLPEGTTDESDELVAYESVMENEIGRYYLISGVEIDRCIDDDVSVLSKFTEKVEDIANESNK